jgi:hypothetical protein
MPGQTYTDEANFVKGLASSAEKAPRSGVSAELLTGRRRSKNPQRLCFIAFLKMIMAPHFARVA